ncbi:hypothetical protein MAE02_45820 [Microvirga aerophila]|uniref:Uncharacterized protein n=1 Tax=Microvirga aerophila TaxID=670291 RepID=A0A512BY55_9HYPH|nr:hypothetical protein MAE02_45820 [Microvirga aerophila]
MLSRYDGNATLNLQSGPELGHVEEPPKATGSVWERHMLFIIQKFLWLSFHLEGMRLPGQGTHILEGAGAIRRTMLMGQGVWTEAYWARNQQYWKGGRF